MTLKHTPKLVWRGRPSQEEEVLINSPYQACTKGMQFGTMLWCRVNSSWCLTINLVLFNILASIVLNVLHQLRRGKLMLAQAFVVVSLCNPTACHSGCIFVQTARFWQSCTSLVYAFDQILLFLQGSAMPDYSKATSACALFHHHPPHNLKYFGTRIWLSAIATG